MTCEFHPEARAEYREAALFYETRGSGLGAVLTLEVEAAISRILEGPGRSRVIEQDVRRCLTHSTRGSGVGSNRCCYAFTPQAGLLAGSIVR